MVKITHKNAAREIIADRQILNDESRVSNGNQRCCKLELQDQNMATKSGFKAKMLVYAPVCDNWTAPLTSLNQIFV